VWEAVDESCMASLNVNGVKIQLQSCLELGLKRGEETECGCILARISIALEIQSYNPCYPLGILKRLDTDTERDITADLIRSALINCADTCPLGVTVSVTNNTQYHLPTEMSCDTMWLESKGVQELKKSTWG